jgi:glyceraldehyde 3-phosphate dehydrogenase
MNRVVINGFGRVGRAAFRAAFEAGSGIDVVAINDVAGAPVLAQLLARDTVYGAFPAAIEWSDHAIVVEGVEIPVFVERDPRRLPWRGLAIEGALECTGKFRKRNEASYHLDAGAKTVIISAPATDPDATIVLGVNDDAYDPAQHRILSNASCTTNCLAPVAKVLHETVGIRHGLMTTIHAYTGDQQLVDSPHKDLRRARAAACNLVPTTTGAAKAIGLVIPELAGKLHGFAVRAPIPTGSIVDLTIEASRWTSVEEINSAFRDAADGDLDGILAYSEAPLVSSDIVKSPYSAVVDAPLTAVLDGTQVKVIAWYDNEWGYSKRLVELAERVGVPVAV